MPDKPSRRESKSVKPTGSGTRAGVRVEKPVRATAQVRPAYELTSFSPGSNNGTHYAVGVIPLRMLINCTVVPVTELSTRTELQETLDEDSMRTLVGFRPDASESAPLVQVVLSSRELWRQSGDTLQMFGNAAVIDGAKRLCWYVDRGLMETEIPFVAYTSLSLQEEILLRESSLLGDVKTTESTSGRVRVGTDTVRLQLGEQWVEFTCESDAFVVATRMGYTPAIHVRRRSGAPIEHLLVQAKSLSVPLEGWRALNGTLIGARVRVRKSGPQRTDPYELIIS